MAQIFMMALWLNAFDYVVKIKDVMLLASFECIFPTK